jgi:hypothetical protein
LVFFHIALRNVVRNWNRTGMIILSMMVASALMTLTLALSSGYAEGVDRPWRQMIGADILVYPNRFVFGGPGPTGTSWEWRELPADLPTDAAFFHPALTAGYLSPAGAPPATFDLTALPTVLREFPGIEGIEPGQLLRASLVLETSVGGATRVPVTLRGRSITADTERFAIGETIVSGRYFRTSHDGDWVALVNQAGFGPTPPPTGGRLVLEVPVITELRADGTPVFDYSRPKIFYFMVYGQYRLALGTAPLEIGVTVDTPQGPGQAGARPTWAISIDEPEVWIPSGTFDLVYREISGQPLRYTRQLGLRCASLFGAKTVAAELAAALPDYTVLTVPQEVALSGIRYRAKLTSLDPYVVEVSRQYFARPTLALDVKSHLSLLAFAVAGLLVVANMYILVTQRRREVGILKAVGASERDILVLFLTETLGYALTGSLLGFLGVRLLTLASLFASRTSLIEGGLLTLTAAGAVIGLTVGTSLVFGFLPAREAARTPTASLLGD